MLQHICLGVVAMLLVLYMALTASLPSFLRDFPFFRNTPTVARQIDNVAIFVQAYTYIEHSVIWDDLSLCVSNVGKAQQLTHSFDNILWENVEKPKPFTFDVYISVPLGTGHFVKPKLEQLGASNVFVSEVEENVGMDIKQFIGQLEQSRRMSTEGYDYFLKIHSKTNTGWRHQALESLCGTPAQVLTVLNTFRNKEKVTGVVVPQGLTITKTCDVNMLYRDLRDYYNSLEIGVAAFMTPVNVVNMKQIYKEMFHKGLDLDEDKYVCAAGTMFWSKYKDFHVQEWVQLLPWLENKWTRGYVQDEGIEHAIERLFVTIPIQAGVNVAEIIPAPKTLGMYFPQYHRTPENDALHGAGFTDWKLLNSSLMDFAAKPLPVNEGGLGYYNLTSLATRRRQGELAREAGLHGFTYHHYWFSGKSSFKYQNPVMGKIPELMLADGEPNLPFMFFWANEPWTWSGTASDMRVLNPRNHVFLPQTYGNVADWEKHFNYLLPFFKHHNYIRVDNKPAFAISRIGLMRRKGLLEKMLHLWRKMATSAGLAGLHIIYTLNNFVHRDKVFESNVVQQCDASFQLFPVIAADFPVKNITSHFNVETRGKRSGRGDEKQQNQKQKQQQNQKQKQKQQQYWGGFSGFSERAPLGRNSRAGTRLVSPQEFKQGLRHSFKTMGEDLPLTATQINTPNLFFMTAWNQWGDQAQLEPSDKHGFAYLSAIKANVENLPMTILKQ
jgi:hypothetical protein